MIICFSSSAHVHVEYCSDRAVCARPLSHTEIVGSNPGGTRMFVSYEFVCYHVEVSVLG